MFSRAVPESGDFGQTRAKIRRNWADFVGDVGRIERPHQRPFGSSLKRRSSAPRAHKPRGSPQGAGRHGVSWPSSRFRRVDDCDLFCFLLREVANARDRVERYVVTGSECRAQIKSSREISPNTHRHRGRERVDRPAGPAMDARRRCLRGRDRWARLREECVPKEVSMVPSTAVIVCSRAPSSVVRRRAPSSCTVVVHRSSLARQLVVGASSTHRPPPCSLGVSALRCSTSIPQYRLRWDIAVHLVDSGQNSSQSR